MSWYKIIEVFVLKRGSLPHSVDECVSIQEGGILRFRGQTTLRRGCFLNGMCDFQHGIEVIT